MHDNNLASQGAETFTTDRLRTLSREEYDELAFGVIELDHDFRVRNYNRPESLLARREPEATIGKAFFEEVAPCTNNPEFRGRIEALMRDDAPARSVRFDFMFRFPWGRRSVIIRAVRDEQLDTCWVFVTPVRAHDSDEE
jgi:photoactive yellow protein